MVKCGFVDVVRGTRRTCTKGMDHDTLCSDGKTSWWHVSPLEKNPNRHRYHCRVKDCPHLKRENYATCHDHRHLESTFPVPR
jgi:hypothetical protein